MPGFVFSLQRVLDLRILEEEEARIALAREQGILTRIARERERLSEELELVRQELSRPGQMTGLDLWLWQDYRERILLESRQLAEQWQVQQNKVAEQRQVLLERTKERKKLEKLKEKQRLEFEEEQRLKEQKDLDETATLRFRHSDF